MTTNNRNFNDLLLEINVLFMDFQNLLNIQAEVCNAFLASLYLPARASEQGNVIGSVRIYIYIYLYKKNCNLAN